MGRAVVHSAIPCEWTCTYRAHGASDFHGPAANLVMTGRIVRREVAGSGVLATLS